MRMGQDLGACAYCQQDVTMGSGTGREPVMYGEGFYELRLQGGANAFIGGVKQKSALVWHKGCAIKHRNEVTNGRQESLL